MEHIEFTPLHVDLGPPFECDITYDIDDILDMYIGNDIGNGNGNDSVCADNYTLYSEIYE